MMSINLPSLAASSIAFKEGHIVALLIIEGSDKNESIELKVDHLVLASLGARIAQILGAYCERMRGPPYRPE